MPSPTADTAHRRADARATLLAVEMYDGTLTDTERVILSVAVNILERQSADAPLREDQRKALFASFSDVFADSDQSTRLAFTRLVLGMSHDEPVSWSTWKPGALTVRQASKVLDALASLGGGGVG